MRVGRSQAELANALLHPDPLDDRALDPARDVVLVADRLGGGRLSDRVDAERLAHGVDGGAKRRRAERVADPQPGEPVDLGEGAQQDQVREPAPEVDRRVGIVVELELDVGLVDDHGDVVGDPLEQLPDPRRRQVGGGRVVGVADDQDLGRGGELGDHRVEIVGVIAVERHADLARPRERCQVGVDRERGPGVDELGAGLTEGQGRREQDLAGAVRDRDLGRIGLVTIGDPAAGAGSPPDRGSGCSPRRRARSPPPPADVAPTATRSRRAGRSRTRRSPRAPCPRAPRRSSPGSRRACARS